MTSFVKLFIGLAFVIVLIAAGPLLTIWALNELFPALAIPYTLSTWVAVIILAAAFRANVSVKRTN